MATGVQIWDASVCRTKAQDFYYCQIIPRWEGWRKNSCLSEDSDVVIILLPCWTHIGMYFCMCGRDFHNKLTLQHEEYLT